MIEDHPELAKYCDMSKLDGHDWVRLAERQPQFLEKVVWQKLSTSDWVQLMTRYPEVVEKFENHTTSEGQPKTATPTMTVADLLGE